jgi:hypothetical protein
MSGQQRYSDDEFDRALRELAEGKACKPRFRKASAAERAKQAMQQAKRARKQTRRRRGRGHAGRGRVTAWTGSSRDGRRQGARIRQVLPVSAGRIG